MSTGTNHPDQFLFHGTGVYALAAIIQSDCLKEGVHWGKPNEPHGPRLTRSYEVAVGFIANNIHWGEGGVLVFDRAALARDYQVVAYTDAQYTGDPWDKDEQEQVVITPAITDLSRYLISVVCDPEVIHLATEPANLAAAKDECGWAFDHENDLLAIRALNAFALHPKLNAWLPSNQAFPHHNNWLSVENDSRGFAP